MLAIALVLSAVFIPAALISGIQGQFYRQFAVTIAASTLISCLVSLTLSPALCALLLKPHEEHPKHSQLTAPIRWFFNGFNWLFDRLSLGYGGLTRRLIRLSVLILVLYGGLIGLAVHQFQRAPTGFIPEQDQGYLITAIQLPPGSSMERTDKVVREVTKLALSVEGTAHTAGFAGFDGATFTNAPNAGAVFVTLKPFEERVATGITKDDILHNLRAKLGSMQEAFVLVINPPPVRGVGTGGGFKMYVEDRRGRGLQALEAVTNELVARANQEPGLTSVFTLFNTRTPKVYADIDRAKAEMLGVPVNNVFDTLNVYLGSSYVNDFNYLGRTYRVQLQADGEFRREVRDIANLKTRNARGDMVPLGSVATFRDLTGAYRVPHNNLYPAAEVQGCHPARLLDRPGDRGHGAARGRGAAGRLRLRVDRARLPGEARRQHGDLRVHRLGRVRVPVPGRPVRELAAAAGGDPDRADVPARRDQRRAVPRAGQQHPGADRPDRAGRPRRQERDPDRRVRQAARGAGRGAAPGRRGRRPHPPAPDPDDLVRLHPGRGAAGHRHRRRRRDAAVAGHGGVLGHARRHPVRPAVHAGVLCRGALGRAAGAASSDGSGRGPAAAALRSDPDLAHAQAAAEIEDLAGDEAGILAEEEGDGGGHLRGLTDPPDRNLRHDGFGCRGVRRIVQV